MHIPLSYKAQGVLRDKMALSPSRLKFELALDCRDSLKYTQLRLSKDPRYEEVVRQGEEREGFTVE